MFLVFSITLFLRLASTNSAKTCWTDGSCSGKQFASKLKSIPNNLTFGILSNLVLSFNDIEKVTSLPAMPRLTNLDLSRNGLKDFSWSSLSSTPNLTRLALNNNELSQVDANVVFPRPLTHLSLQNNRIATFPETFLSGVTPHQNIFYFRIWGNSFHCDDEIHWIVRLRQCVLNHRMEGCVDKKAKEVKICMMSNCNFHPSGVLVILDSLEKEGIISHLRPRVQLSCKSPKELQGKLLRDIQLPTARPPNAPASPPPGTFAANTSVSTGTEVNDERKATEHPTPTAHSWDRTTASDYKFSFDIVWKTPASAILGVILALLLVFSVVQCFKRCKKKRQALLDKMAAGPALCALSGMPVTNISSRVDLTEDVIGGNLPRPRVSPSGSESRPKRHSFQHDYDEIKDEDIDKMRGPLQSDQSAYSEDGTHRLDAGKLYGHHRPVRGRDMRRQNRVTCIGVETQRQSQLRRQNRHHRRPGLDDRNLYRTESSEPTGQRHHSFTASVPRAGILYRSGTTPPIESRRRRHLKKEGTDGPFELNIRGRYSPPSSEEDVPPPVPSRVGRPKLFPNRMSEV
ncbi:hypothetical protein Bbelb_156270 [Branchiostoma belcheri]|nr:hypothetical protein Bbelb_156270 [Branchiostoma belcheri]